MTTLYRRNNTGERRRLVIATVAVVVIFILDTLTGGTLRGFVQRSAAAVWQGIGTGVHALDYGGWLASRSALARDNANLRAQLAIAQDKIGGYQALHEQYTELEATVNMAGQDAMGVVAHISSPLSLTPNDTFIVDRGARDNVQIGYIAESDAGFVIGSVVSVMPDTALVRKVLSSGVSLRSTVDKNSVMLTMKSGSAYGHLSHDATVAAGDAVFAPDFGNRPIGVVVSTHSASSSAYTDIYVDLPTNPSALQFIYLAPGVKK